jgi:hypothetical protein
MSESNRMTGELLVKISERFPNIWAWRNNRVDAMAVGSGGRMRRVSAGLDGQADIAFVLGPMGRFGGIEVKAGKDKMRDSQKHWSAKLMAMGGAYLLCRDVSVTLEELAVIYRGEGN